jgi:hypothetical protein
VPALSDTVCLLGGRRTRRTPCRSTTPNAMTKWSSTVSVPSVEDSRVLTKVRSKTARSFAWADDDSRSSTAKHHHHARDGASQVGPCTSSPTRSNSTHFARTADSRHHHTMGIVVGSRCASTIRTQRTGLRSPNSSNPRTGTLHRTPSPISSSPSRRSGAARRRRTGCEGS